MNARTPARHRSRASAACLPCRKARIRCVTNHPDNSCVNCKDNGYECRFDAKDGRKERASAKAVTESLTKRVHQLEELLRATQPMTTAAAIPSRVSYMDSIDAASLSLSVPASGANALLTLDQQHNSPMGSMYMLDDSATTTAAEAYINAIVDKRSPADSEAANASSPLPPSNSASPASSLASITVSVSASASDDPTSTTATTATTMSAPSDSASLGDIPTTIPPPSTKDIADTPDTTTDTASVVRSLVPSPIRFDMSSGRVRYFGPTTNMNVLTLIPPDADGNADSGDHQLRRTASGNNHRRQHPEAHWPISLVVRDLSPATHDYLMDQYWTCYNSVLHLVHSDAFNHDLERGGTQFYSLFLHLAMLATGFRFADKTRADVQRLAMSAGGRFGSTLHEKAVALAKLEFDRPGGIPSIQAFGLLADVDFNIGRDESGWLFAGMSLRLVIDVGLHVDPSPLHLTVKEAQIRHMVLWACILHDMYWSLYLGRPTTLKPVDIAPACLSKDFTRLICCRPSGHEKKLTTRIYEHLLQLMDLISPLCDRSTLARPSRTTETYFKMVALDEDLHGWYDDLPEDLKWPTSRPTNMPSSYYLLHTQYHAALILLHRPFVQYRGAGLGGGGTGGAGSNSNSAGGTNFDDDDNNSNTEFNDTQHGSGSRDRNRFTSLSRSVCAEHAGHIVALFQEYRAQFDVSRVFGTGLSHLGTAATTLMGEAVLEMDRAKRGVVIVQLMSVRRSINLMSGNYPPGHHMTRILDEFIQAVRQQQREGMATSSPPPPPPQTTGLSQVDDSLLDPALRRVGSVGDLQKVSFMGDTDHTMANQQQLSSNTNPSSLLMPQRQQQQQQQQPPLPPYPPRQSFTAKHPITTALDDINLNVQLQGDLYQGHCNQNQNQNYNSNSSHSNSNNNSSSSNNHARKRQRIGNPCTFTPTVPASPSLQGLPFVPSSFLESLDASDLVIFPETTGYSDYGFEWDPADLTAI